MEWFDVKSVAELFGTSVVSVNQWISQGRLKAWTRPCAITYRHQDDPDRLRRRVMKKRFIPRTELENFLVGRVEEGRASLSLKDLLEDGQQQGDFVVSISEDAQSGLSRNYGAPETRAALWHRFRELADSRVKLRDMTESVKYPTQLGFDFGGPTQSAQPAQPAQENAQPENARLARRREIESYRKTGDHYYECEETVPKRVRPPKVKPVVRHSLRMSKPPRRPFDIFSRHATITKKTTGTGQSAESSKASKAPTSQTDVAISRGASA